MLSKSASWGASGLIMGVCNPGPLQEGGGGSFTELHVGEGWGGGQGVCGGARWVCVGVR